MTKYRLDIAPHLLIPIRHTPKYALTNTYSCHVNIPVKLLEKLKPKTRENTDNILTLADTFILREFVAKQVQTEIKKEFPKAKWANIINMWSHYPKKDVKTLVVDVDVLE